MSKVQNRWRPAAAVTAAVAALATGPLSLTACTGGPGPAAGRTSRPAPATLVTSPQAALYLVPAGGGAARPLLPTRTAAQLASVSSPVWSPDGKRIAFAAGCVSCPSKLYVAGRDGRGLREVPTGAGSVTSPDWSPDGSWIVFARERGESQELYAVDPHTGRLRLVNSERTELDNTDTTPAWSPDDRWIAFTREVHHERVNLYAVPADGGRPRPLTRPTQYGQSHPSWSPGGRRIVFMQTVPPRFTWDLFLLDASGGKARPLTRTPGNEFDPAWSPGGRRIVFASDAASRAGFRSLYVCGADGSGLRRLTAGAADDSMPSWSPDGSTIVFVRRPVVRT